MRSAIGIDVGGTKIAAGLVDLTAGRLIERMELPTPRGESAETMLAAIAEAAERMQVAAKTAGIVPAGIGIGLPELVRLDGVPASDWITQWRKRDLTRDLVRFHPVMVDSDVRLATLAELHYGHGRSLPSFVYVSIGTGLSCAVCENGAIRRGAHGFAIHFASSDLVSYDAAGGRERVFNLEGFASGLGMSRVYQLRTGRAATARDIVEGRAGQDGAALLEEATTALASYIGQIVNMIDPHGVVIGGGTRHGAALLRDAARQGTGLYLGRGLPRSADPAQRAQRHGRHYRRRGASWRSGTGQGVRIRTVSKVPCGSGPAPRSFRGRGAGLPDAPTGPCKALILGLDLALKNRRFRPVFHALGIASGWLERLICSAARIVSRNEASQAFSDGF